MSARSPLFGQSRGSIHSFISRVRPLLALSLALLLFASPLSFAVASASEQSGAIESSSKTSDVDSFIIEMVGGAATCRDATPAEVPLTISRPDDHGVPVKALIPTMPPTANAQAQGGENVNTPLTINLLALSQLQGDPNKDAVIAAFQKAASYWTARIKSPTTMTVNIDYGPNSPGGGAFGPNTLGATGSLRTTIDYAGFLTNLKASSNGAGETAVYNALPTSFVPTDTGNGAVVSVARPLARSLGLPVSATPLADATIGFNSAFQFDFNPDDGIDAGKTDFVAVAAHEIGHALGFSSNAGQGNTSNVSALDVFRFRPGTTDATFSTANRIMSIGGTQVYYTGQSFPVFSRPTSASPAAQTGTSTELGFSTGGPNGVTTNDGDGRQSSHWKADEQTQVFVGIMDPTIASGVRLTPTENDFSAFETIGWDLTGNAVIPPAPPAPPAPFNDNFANAQALGGCKGNVEGINVGATAETNEPNHSPDNGGGHRSVWYKWTAPGSQSVTITTSGSTFDTVLSVYTGGNFGSLTPVPNGKNDDAVPGSDLTSSVTFNASGGTTYVIAVDGYNNSGSGGDMGVVKLDWNLTSCGNAPDFMSFMTNASTVGEGVTSGVVTVTVTRNFMTTSTAASVDYRTSDTSGVVPCQTNGNGIASERCDYATSAGTLRFAAGETSKTIQIPVINDAYVEPNEVFTVTLQNPQGTSLNNVSTATVIIQNDDTQTATHNPIDDQAFFIKAQYIDFLGRVAEQAGFDFWMNRMNGNCPAGQICDRVDTSQRFFQSDEFQERGFYVYRLYDAILGRLPKYASEFVLDGARLNGFQTVAEQRASKDTYLNDFVNKAEFKALYGQYLSANLQTATNPTGFVDALCSRAGITPTGRQSLINNLQSGTKDPAHTVEDFILTLEISGVGTLYYDRGFITMQYFGYLRRDPEQAGFDFWVGQLIGADAPHRGDYRFMVKGFLQSDEYRYRFTLISGGP
jgi:hypothetical protein